LYKRQIKDVDELCEHILPAWDSDDTDDTTVEQWPPIFVLASRAKGNILNTNEAEANGGNEM